MDEAIRATEAVIEQTRRVKEGLLQELLTKGIGQTRFKKTPIGEIPEGWEVKRLGDIAKVERGRFSHRPRNAPHLYGGRYPFVQTGDVAAAERITAYRQTLNEAGKATSKLFPANTILIGIVGANVGEAAITTFEVACPDSIIAIRPDSVSTEWLFQAATTWKPFLQNQSTQNARQNINLETLRPMLIGVPPIEEQEKVAAVTTSFSQSLETLRENLRALETAKQGLLQDLLTVKVRVSV
ncbi:MAG: restriction endonuclease subunit S [Candidatus Eremiobacteraeota bacterium]|nr:restriction endonuclease subunit S [Candidatus Eremiobacteraeota bacterium]